MTDNAVTRMFGAFLNDLLNEKGFVLPIHMVVLGANGAVMSGTYSESGEGLSFDQTAEYLPDGGFMKPPLNLIFVDSRGEAARIVVEQGGTPKWVN